MGFQSAPLEVFSMAVCLVSVAKRVFVLTSRAFVCNLDNLGTAILRSRAVCTDGSIRRLRGHLGHVRFPTKVPID